MKASAIAIFSGGLDSTVAIAETRLSNRILLALTFDYGQRAALPEIAAARFFCELYEIPHQVIELPWLARITKTALVDRSKNIPQLTNDSLSNLTETKISAEKVWVPNRNALFIAVAACFAESLKVDTIVTGFNREEAASFPDNSAAFVEAINQSLEFSTLSKPKVVCPLIHLSKNEILVRAQEFEIPLDRIWSCYESGPNRCGVCEGCLRSSPNR